MVTGQSNYFFGFSLVPNAPYIVYAQGDLSLLQRPKLSIVGPRAMTTYGKDVVEHIFSFLPSYDLVTVSGGADGVDMLCHQLSLQYNIPTIVVL
jgi:predicted Rossmann fold nucleotide-binding protein DprA/Smf involved in DNA uptake